MNKRDTGRDFITQGSQKKKGEKGRLTVALEEKKAFFAL